MKRRITIFEKLEEKSTSALTGLIQELKKEIYDFYQKLDLYYHYQLNCQLFYSIYLSNTYTTILDLSFDLCIDTKMIQKFILNTDDFVYSIMNHDEKYTPLSVLL